MAAGMAAGVAYESTGIPRRDETPQSLYASDVFSAGVTLFMLVAYNAILARVMTETFCSDVEAGDERSLPAMNIFQPGAGEGVFDLLRADVVVQQQFWSYWEVYGLRLPASLKGLLDGLLHPVLERRFSLDQAFAWIDDNPEMSLED